MLGEMEALIVKCPSCNERQYYGQISIEYAAKIEIKTTCGKCGIHATRTISVSDDKK